jgi:hypothetical protein
MQLCPICAVEARATIALSAEHIRTRLAEEFSAAVPAALPLDDYQLRQCTTCELVFADPMRAGGSEFYRWVTSYPAYHAEARWEWGCLRRIPTERKQARLLGARLRGRQILAVIADLKHVDAQGRISARRR